MIGDQGIILQVEYTEILYGTTMKISKSVSAKVQKAMYSTTAYFTRGAHFIKVIARLGNASIPAQKLYHPRYCTLTIWYIEYCLQKSISQLSDNAITITMTKLSINVSLCIEMATTAITKNPAIISQNGM